MVGRLVTVVEVSLELPLSGDLGELLDGSLAGRDGVQVLEVGANTLELEGGPDEDLVNTVGMVTPLAEHVGGGLVSLAGLLDGVLVLPEEDL